jgi:tight adherence protein B
MRRRFAFVVAVCLLLPAAASAGIGIRGVDTSAYPNVRVTIVTPEPSATPPTLLENGRPVAVVRAQNLGRDANVALLIDNSRSMRGASLANAKAAARQFLLIKPSGDQVAVFTFGNTATQLTTFSAAAADADQQLSTLEVDRHSGTALYDAVSLASSQLATQPTGARLILLLTDGKDVSSTATLDAAVRAAHVARVTVYSVGIESSQFTPDALQALSSATGGVYRGAARGDLVGLYQSIGQELRRTWRIEYLTASRPGQSLSVSASVPGQGSVSASVVLSGIATPSGSKPSLPKSIFTSRGTIIFALIIGLLVMIAIRLVFRKSRGEEMRRRIQPHVAQEAHKIKKKRDRSSLLRGLFSSTEHVLGKSRQWSSLARLLERGDVPLKTVEFAYVILGSGLLLGFLASVMALHGIFLFVAFAIGALLPVGFVWRKSKKRLAAFDEQLPDLLMAVAASLKAGHSFKQGIQTIVDEAQEPAKKEFQRVLAESSLGRQIDDSLADMAERLGSKNFSFIVTAVTIQSQVGGSLAGLFDMVADTVRQRQQFSRKIRALTAMGRASAYVLIALPIFLAMLLTAINHTYMSPLFFTSTGHKLMIVGLIMMAIGSALIRKIVTFKG